MFKQVKERDALTVSFSVTTNVEGAKITAETKIQGMFNQFYKRVVETEDEQIREALIHLGWTPPSDT